MTREEAIEVIKAECYIGNLLDLDGTVTVNTALDMAIKALEQQPCEDCISREAALNIFGEVHPLDYNTKAYITEIEGLPSVTPRQIKGRWITHPKGVYAHLVCSKCLTAAPYDCPTFYCPKCGAQMEVEE